MDKIWDRKSFEVGGHWPLWRGWKKRMITQNRQKSNAKKNPKKHNNNNNKNNNISNIFVALYRQSSWTVLSSMLLLHPHTASCMESTGRHPYSPRCEGREGGVSHIGWFTDGHCVRVTCTWLQYWRGRIT